MVRLCLVAAIVLSLSTIITAQTEDTAPAPQHISRYLRVCSDKNPPPCAETAPKAIDSPPPAYPDDAHREGVEGTVILVAVVGTDGRAHDIRVSQTVGHGLDEQAIKTLKQWKFKPGMSKGAPVPVLVNVQIAFRITQ